MLRVPAAWAGLVFLAIAGSAGSAVAQGLELGPFRILPSLGLSLEYDDNIFLTPDNEIDDFIFHIIPGVVIELPSRKYAIRLGYQADILRYMDNTDLDTIHHSVLADARAMISERAATEGCAHMRRTPRQKTAGHGPHSTMNDSVGS